MNPRFAFYDCTVEETRTSDQRPATHSKCTRSIQSLQLLILIGWGLDDTTESNDQGVVPAPIKVDVVYVTKSLVDTDILLSYYCRRPYQPRATT